MIKILHVVHSLNEGGIERLLLEICRGINKDKFEISICCLVEKGSIADEFEKLGIDIFILEAKRDFSFKNLLVNLNRIWKLSRIVRRNNFEITHGHEFYSTVFSRISGVLGRARLRFITLHNMYYWWGKGVHVFQKLLSFVTHRIVCNSLSTLEYSVEKDKIRRDKYVIIYNGIDCGKYKKKDVDRKDFIRQYNISSDSIICMSVGSVSPRKGYEYLIRAAEMLKAAHPELVYFIVGGKHHQEYEEYGRILKLIENCDLTDRVFITGPQRNVDQILNYCDLYIMPSVVEGFGISLAEALSMERAVIASDIPPFKEIIDDELNGFLFRSRDYVDLANKIKRVVGLEKNVLENIRKNARKKIMENFSSPVMIQKYENLYSIQG